MINLAVAAAAVGVAGLGAVYMTDLRREKSRRSVAFDDCQDLLQDRSLHLEEDGYPSLAGRFDGHEVGLKLLADTIQLRKLPILWLMVTVKRKLPVPGVLDLMVRASNSEYYSPHGELNKAIPLPKGWHDQLTIRSDKANAMSPLLGPLEGQVNDFLDDGRGKEILITPRGVRLVYRFAESDRGHYLVTRLPKFEQQKVEMHTASMLLRQAMNICDTVEHCAQ